MSNTLSFCVALSESFAAWRVMSRQKAQSQITVFKLPKSGGVVVRDPSLRKASRTNRVREYFYGPRNRLRPHSQTVSLRELAVYRIGTGMQAPSSALPIGGDPQSCFGSSQGAALLYLRGSRAC